jgi:hypothetical protein
VERQKKISGTFTMLYDVGMLLALREFTTFASEAALIASVAEERRMYAMLRI